MDFQVGTKVRWTCPELSDMCGGSDEWVPCDGHIVSVHTDEIQVKWDTMCETHNDPNAREELISHHVYDYLTIMD